MWMTLEPVDAPEDARRILLENRVERVGPAYRLHLVTLLEPAGGGRLLVEIHQGHDVPHVVHQVTVYVEEAPYPAALGGPHGNWQWSLLLRDLPIERGGCAVRLSGRGLPECRDYDLVPLDAYWAGRSDLVGSP